MVLVAAATLVAATGRIIDGFLAVADIARVRLEARADELTGLGNRRLLYETELLRTMGCDVAQGYYFGRPRPGAPMLAEAADAAAIDDLARHQMVKS